jgi:CBS domain-containing protein
VTSVPSTAFVKDAWQIMQEQSVGCVLIMDGSDLKGIFTERDLLRRVLATGRSLDTPLSEVMTREVVTLDESQEIIIAMRQMQEGGYRHIPILGANGKPRGILSIKRLMSYCIEHYPNSIYNYPPTPDPSSNAEGA